MLSRFSSISGKIGFAVAVALAGAVLATVPPKPAAARSCENQACSPTDRCHRLTGKTCDDGSFPCDEDPCGME